MTARSPSALLLSASLHAGIVALAVLFSFLVQTQVQDQPKVMELVAGDGDNYAATEAPALGTPNGVKVTIPEPPAPKPTPPAPVTAPKPEPAPVITKAPVETPVKPAPTTPDFSKQIKRTIIRKEANVRREIKKEREAEAKRLSKEEFDRQHRAKVAAASGNPKVTKIDAEGIAGGVANGSTANKTGGAGDKALSRADGDLMDAYFSLVKRRLKESLDKPPGLSDSLTAVAEFRLGADGSVSGAHISKSSGSAEFDRAVLEAVDRYRSVGARPDRKSETVSVTFRMREDDDG